MAAIDSGIEPDKELEAKDTFWRDNKSPIEVGISPSSPFDERFKNRRFSRQVIELGIFPLRLLPDKSMWYDCMPVTLTATLETVKSVRFCNQPSQTPVNLLRLLMQVKDRRFEASSDNGVGDGDERFNHACDFVEGFCAEGSLDGGFTIHCFTKYHGRGHRFVLASGRDPALVNKGCDFLKDHLLVPPNWRQDENKGLIRSQDGRWIQPERPRLEDHPDGIHLHLTQLGLASD
ncbi:hypothetical protein U1Q18_043960 [Sarracenia purpurea var. burkii]